MASGDPVMYTGLVDDESVAFGHWYIFGIHGFMEGATGETLDCLKRRWEAARGTAWDYVPWPCRIDCYARDGTQYLGPDGKRL